MSRTDQAECRATLLRETPLAMEVQQIGAAWTFWFPRSEIGYLRKDKDGDRTIVVFTVPEWLVEAKQAWGIVP